MKIFLITLLITTSTFASYPTETFCQDMNVIFHKMSVANMNIANAQTTRTAEGGPYKKRTVLSCSKGLCKEKIWKNEIISKYDPSHPDANEQGYVDYPNINVMEEMSNLIRAQRTFEIVKASANFDYKDILLGDKFQFCFKKYSYFKDFFNLKGYLWREPIDK